jgi:hypothetical protein
MSGALECNEAIALLEAGEDLSAEMGDRLGGHLENCDACQSEMNSALEELSSYDDGAPTPEVSDGEWAGVWEKISQEVAPKKTATPSKEPLPFPAATEPGRGGWVMALALLAATILVMLSLPFGPTPKVPSGTPKVEEPMVASGDDESEADVVVEEMEVGEEFMATATVPGGAGGITFIWLQKAE